MGRGWSDSRRRGVVADAVCPATASARRDSPAELVIAVVFFARQLLDDRVESLGAIVLVAARWVGSALMMAVVRSLGRARGKGRRPGRYLQRTQLRAGRRRRVAALGSSCPQPCTAWCRETSSSSGDGLANDPPQRPIRRPWRCRVSRQAESPPSRRSRSRITSPTLRSR